jgi:hypothetical protein
VDEAKKDVLSTDVIVIEHARFFLGQYNDPASSIGKAFEHLFHSLLMLSKPLDSDLHPEPITLAQRVRSEYRALDLGVSGWFNRKIWRFMPEFWR